MPTTAGRTNFPGARSLASVLATGVSKLAGWIFSYYNTDTMRLHFLHERYPNARSNVLSNVLGTLEEAASAGRQLESGLGMPPLADIPRDPSIGDRGRIRVAVNVVVRGEETSDEGITDRQTYNRTVVVTANVNASEEEIRRAANEAFDQLTEESPLKYDFLRHLSEIERFTEIQSITRG